MYQEKFRTLIDQVYDTMNVAAADRTYEVCQLEVEGAQFTLAYSTTDADKVISFCEYGVPPAERRAEILARLLEVNVLSYDSKAPHYAINPESGAVVFILQISLDDLTAERLIELLALQAMGASTWRITHFLEDRELALEQVLASEE